ncbi:MAG TPA: ACT domain-containing protein, partial [Gammaproteobacteria bacterium]|nr:ACT domain-containing protein [Gammaproteobacteria bacterium]
EEVGVRAEVKGRPKHIYSIWKKMRGKGVGFHELFDVRAVRILVDSVADCYHALGVVHTLWRHIPKEFDDYIATPKENNYQSIHTAVVGPEGKVLEVQIRTHEMDRHAELGVAAHWRYKEGGKGAKGDRHFEQKVAWLRQLLDWKEEEANAGDFIDRFKSEVFQDRVYVLTPQGEVMDLPQGATPLDFAYHIHTEVGHRCRGAKVDGRMVSLTYELKSGEQVSILTARHGGPSRDWLNRELGYLKTNRAYAKVRHWFKQQDQQRNLNEGRAALDREMRRLGVEGLEPEKVAGELGYKGLEELLIALGRGDASTAQVARVVHRLMQPEADAEAEAERKVLERRGRPARAKDDAVRIHGVGNLLTNLARCCKPAPGDPIMGFITQGRGVTIHRGDCRNVLNLRDDKRNRLIEVEWGGGGHTYPVDIEVRAYDRQGLLRDVSAILANEKINVVTLNTRTDPRDHSARILFTMEVTNTNQLSRVLSRINQLPNVLEARRHH